MRRFMRLCCCMSGGRYNPIIPWFGETPEWLKERFRISEGLEVTRRYVEFFEPDVLVEVVPHSCNALGWKEGGTRYDLRRVISLEELSNIDERGRWDFRCGISMQEVFAELYETVYQFERRHKANFIYFNPSEERDAFFDAIGGTFPEDEIFKRMINDYQDVFAAEELPATADTHRKMLETRSHGPLWITKHSLKEHQGNFRYPTIYIFDPLNGQDVLDYWNSFLFGGGTFPVNVHWLSNFSKILQDFIVEHHRSVPGDPDGFMTRTGIVCGHSISSEKSDEIVEQHFAELPKDAFFRSSLELVGPSRARWDTRKIIVESGSTTFDDDVNEDGYVRIPAPTPTFQNKTKKYRHHLWMNVIQPSASVRGDDRTAIVLPLNNWDPVFPHRTLTHHPLAVTREGWVTSHTVDIGYSLVQPLSGRDAFVEWFKSAKNISAKPSDAGQNADELIRAAGDLRSCGMFADADTLRFLNRMAGSYLERNEGAKKYQSKEPDHAKHFDAVAQHFKLREKRSWGYWAKLDHFLKQSVFRAGLQVKCSKCGFSNWYDLPSLHNTLTCTRCLELFDFDFSPNGLRSAKWYYRVIGPFATPDFARGGYAVALTLSCLVGRFHHYPVTWTTGLELKELKCEIDFALWISPNERLGLEFSESYDPTLLVGEVKSFGDNRDTFDQDDTEKLKRVGELLPGAILVVAALKTMDKWTETEKSLVVDLINWGRATYIGSRPRNPVMCLTGTELLSEGPLSKVWEDAGGKAAKLVAPASINLENPHELAELTQQLYFDMPSYYQDLSQRRRRASSGSSGVASSN